MKKIFILLVLSQYSILIPIAIGTQCSFAQNNENISLQGKSVMYRMGGKIFYGRPIKNLSVEQQNVNISDSSAMMKINKKDVFGDVMEKNLNPISDTDIALIETHETTMKVRKTDVFGIVEQKNLSPLPEQKMTLVKETENANMKVRAQDAFGNYVYENLNPVSTQKVILLDENETVMKVTTTDAFGNFAFENLSPDKNYKIKMEFANNPDITNDEMIYLANNDNMVLQAINFKENPDFQFSVLSADKTKISLMEAVEVKMEGEGKE